LPYTFGSGEDHPCGVCLKEPPKFVKAAAPLLYEGVVEDAVKLFKYRKVRALKDFLGEFVASEAERSFQGATVAVAVPLHPKRLRYRGFNQALFLAESAARSLGIALNIDGLARVRHTRPQVDLGPEERLANVKGAFAVVRPEDFKGQAVLLVDDVYTTGATVKECARVLKKSGAKSVSVLTVARVNIR
jgi:ComF family protein